MKEALIQLAAHVSYPCAVTLQRMFEVAVQAPRPMSSYEATMAVKQSRICAQTYCMQLGWQVPNLERDDDAIGYAAVAAYLVAWQQKQPLPLLARQALGPEREPLPIARSDRRPAHWQPFQIGETRRGDPRNRAPRGSGAASMISASRAVWVNTGDLGMSFSILSYEHGRQNGHMFFSTLMLFLQVSDNEGDIVNIVGGDENLFYRISRGSGLVLLEEDGSQGYRSLVLTEREYDAIVTAAQRCAPPTRMPDWWEQATIDMSVTKICDHHLCLTPMRIVAAASPT